MNHSELTALLKKEVVPALGCTAPIADALAAASSAAQLSGEITDIDLVLSPGMYKNGWGVAVPGTSERGNALGAAYGAFGGDASLGLEVLNPAGADELARARAFVQAGHVHVRCDTEKSGVYIEAVVRTAKDSARTIISGGHSDIVYVEKNGTVVFEKSAQEAQHAHTAFAYTLSLEDILSYASNVPFADIAFLKDGVAMNMALAADGLNGAFGLQSGRILQKSLHAVGGDKLPAMRARILACAASDARMGGSLLPAMSTVGSGNQGITAILPVAVYAESIGASDEATCRALAVSHLTTYMVKSYVGRISSTCLCAIASASGAAAAITYLAGGTLEQMRKAVKNVVSPLAGLICDGAKNGCALKMGAAAVEAFCAAELALGGSAAGHFDGLAADSLEDTLANLGKLTDATRTQVDSVIVGILNEKSNV